MPLIRRIMGGLRFRDRFTSDTPIVGITAVKDLLYVATKERIYALDDKGKLMPLEYGADITPPDEE